VDDETGKVADRRDVERPHLAFGRELEEARKGLSLGRPELAQLSGISYPMLANVETGRRRASDELIAKLAPSLGVPPQRLI
jgi:transcriptional regulator with XRE-family HTH domain